MSKTVITSPNAPAAIGTYSQAIKAGNTVYLSGQIPLDPKTMELVEGPFRSLEGVWTLTPLGQEGAGKAAGCRVELDLNFEPTGGLAGLALAPLIEHMAGALVDAFVQRAKQVYGPR